MALFSKKTNPEPAAVVPAVVKAAPVADVSGVLLRPRITEKAAILADHNAYAFEVKQGATKDEVIQAVKAVYKVTPRDVRFTPIPSKRVFVRGKWGHKAAGRKAYVYLNKGDKIELL